MPTLDRLLPPTVRLPLVVCVAATAVFAGRWHFAASTRRDPHGSVAGAVARLRERGQPLHVVATNACTADLTDGAFVCERERPWAAVNRLCRHPACGADWAGIVHMQTLHDWEVAQANLLSWGEYGARVGDLLLFGDPRLLRRVVTVLQD
jgi:hypothetical protein